MPLLKVSIPDEQANAFADALDEGLARLLWHAESRTGKRWFIEKQVHMTGFLLKTKRVTYTVHRRLEPNVYTPIDFGPEGPDGRGRGMFVSRQVVVAFLLGVVNGSLPRVIELSKRGTNR